MFLEKTKDMAAQDAAISIDYLIKECRLKTDEIDQLLEDADWLAEFQAESFCVLLESYHRPQ